LSLTPASVLLSLDDALRNDLLSRNNIDPTKEYLAGDFSGLGKLTREALEQDLNCIATLGTDYATQLLHDYLAKEGWTAENFAASGSTRDRAGALLCRNPEAFFEALAIWNGNRLRGRLDREQGFRLPELADFSFSPLSDAENEALTTLISQVVSDSYPAKVVSRIKVFERDSRGLSTSSSTVLQCDISIGDDPENIEVIEDGQETSVTISRLSRISVIIDPGAGTLFVGTELGKKKMHEALACVLVQALFDMETTPERLSPLRVYPEKCKAPVYFSYSVNDNIEMPRISELRYRLFGAPNTLVYSVRDEEPGSLIHDLDDVQKHAKRMRIWRAVIDFVFKPPGDHPPLRRSATLTEPSSVSFGRSFPEERIVMERVLTASGLIDPNFSWDSRARFSDVARLVTPHHAAELRQTWLPLTVLNLTDAGVLVQGAPHPRAWCSVCGETHGIRTVTSDEGKIHLVECPVDPCPATADHVDTLVLSIVGLLSWLGKIALASTGTPQQIGTDASRSWLLGRASHKGKGKPYDLILAIDVDRPQTTRDLNEFLLRQHTGGRGVILTLVDDPVQKGFPGDWRATPLHSVCDVTKSGLKFRGNRASAIAHGRSAKAVQKSDEDWDQIFALFEVMFPDGDQLQHFTVANQMIAAEPEVCDMTPRTLADQLFAKFPQRFAARAG
jgi:hypothetical protein